MERAIATYLGSADFRALKPGSQGDYRRVLDRFRAHIGQVLLPRITEPWLQASRDKYAPDRASGDGGRANDWNALRSRMIAVVDTYRKRHPEAAAGNPWRDAHRLKTVAARSHRPWPSGVLLKVMAGATPEFRAPLVGYLLTAQRGGDVTAFSPDRYDPAARTLDLQQEKTGEPMLIHVPETLARDRGHARAARRLPVHHPAGPPLDHGQHAGDAANLADQPRPAPLHAARAPGDRRRRSRSWASRTRPSGPSPATPATRTWRSTLQASTTTRWRARRKRRWKRSSTPSSTKP